METHHNLNAIIYTIIADAIMNVQASSPEHEMRCATCYYYKIVTHLDAARRPTIYKS